MTADDCAKLLATVDVRGRRAAKRLLRDSGGEGTGPELDRLIARINQRHDFDDIRAAADDMASMWLQAEQEAGRARTGTDAIDEWLIAEGSESGRYYVVHLGRTPFVAEIDDTENGLTNFVWLGKPAEGRREMLLAEARAHIELYDERLGVE